MVDFSNIWAIARTESRLTRRLARFWVFCVISVLFSALAFLNFWAIYFFGSGDDEAPVTRSSDPRHLGSLGGVLGDRDDEGMTRLQRVDRQERDADVVLPDEAPGELPVDDSGEYGGHRFLPLSRYVTSSGG